jgi:hypothetical protein
LAALVLLLFAAPAAAADRLSPAAAQPAVVSDAFASDVEVFAVIRPPFAPQYAVGLRGRDGDYRVFAVSADAQVWPQLVKGASAGPQYCETAIGAALGQRIAAVWDAMLRAAGSDADSDAGVDLAHYDFAKVVDRRLAVGSAWDRDGDSKVGMLQAIAVDMQVFCHSPGAFERERFVSRVDALAAQLQQPPVEKTP